MFYVASKLFFALARPFHLLIFLLVAGFIAQLLGRRRVATVLIGVVAIGFVTIAFTPVSTLLIRPLEERFPRPALVDPAPDGILVLGGAFDTASQAGHPDFIALNDAAERLTELPGLAKRYPNARIVYTGGPDDAPDGSTSEALAARRLMVEAGIDPARITLEDKSLTTWDNAVFTRAIVQPAPGSRWLLVTSAYHMTRSVGVFRKAGWPGLIPFPTDYRAPGYTASVPWRTVGAENLWTFEVAVKEYIGLAGYWLGGRSSELWPGP